MLFRKICLSRPLKATSIIALSLLFHIASSQAQVRSTPEFSPSIISFLLNQDDSNCNAIESISAGLTLVTQSDVTALEGVTQIQGDLILAPSSASIDYSPLSELREVTGNLVFANSNISTDVDGFDCLESVGGEFETSGSSNYNITLEFLGAEDFTPGQQQIFHDAASRWEEILEGSQLENIFIAGSSSSGCFDRGKPTFVEDLHIQITTLPSDGIGGIETRATPTGLRAGTFLPFSGCLEIDLVDFARLQADGTLEATLTHEMAHVLGFGTIWSQLGLIQDPLPNSVPNLNIPQPKYVGTNGVSAWNTAGGLGSFVPVENGFSNGLINGAGPGAVNMHWDKSFFASELMTFKIDPADSNFPLSAITIGSLQDLGYVVDISLADLFLLE